MSSVNVMSHLPLYLLYHSFFYLYPLFQWELPWMKLKGKKKQKRIKLASVQHSKHCTQGFYHLYEKKITVSNFWKMAFYAYDHNNFSVVDLSNLSLSSLFVLLLAPGFCLFVLVVLTPWIEKVHNNSILTISDKSK